MVSTLIFVSMMVLSAIAVYFGFYSKKFSFEENKQHLKLRAYGLLLLAFGFIVHTLGDVLSAGYGGDIELTLESSAHVIILIAFVFFIISAKEILKTAKEYWFK